MEAQLACNVAVIGLRPLAPCFFNLIIESCIKTPAALHPHLRLKRYALANDVNLNRSQRLLGVVVVAAQLACAVA